MLEPVGEVNVSWIVLEGDGEVLFEDEEQDHHHLHWCLNAPADAVPNLNNNHRTYDIDGWQRVRTSVPPKALRGELKCLGSQCSEEFIIYPSIKYPLLG